jgi:hypothetical protein
VFRVRLEVPSPSGVAASYFLGNHPRIFMMGSRNVQSFQNRILLFVSILDQLLVSIQYIRASPMFAADLSLMLARHHLERAQERDQVRFLLRRQGQAKANFVKMDGIQKCLR